jgi:putative iron-dependent peroxidase
MGLGLLARSLLLAFLSATGALGAADEVPLAAPDGQRVGGHSGSNEDAVVAVVGSPPQPNVLSGLDREAIGLTVYLAPAAWTDAAAGRAVALACARFPDMVAAVESQLAAHPDGSPARLTAGLGFSADAWRRWGASRFGVPAGMRDFAGYAGPSGWPSMEPTGGDLFVHAKCARRDGLYALTRAFVGALNAGAAAPIAVIERTDCVDAWHNVVDGRNRDLTGYIDGTANCPPAEAARAALIARDPIHANGSFAIAQRWVHDLAAFGRLAPRQQDEVFGRTKEDSVRLPDAPPSAHAVRVDQKRLGYKVVRQAMPWGDADRAGLFFVAFADDAAKLETMCRAMVGLPVSPGDAGGVADAVMRFSTPVSSNFWYFPSVGLLRALAP